MSLDKREPVLRFVFGEIFVEDVGVSIDQLIPLKFDPVRRLALAPAYIRDTDSFR